jgi:hypothetical protein
MDTDSQSRHPSRLGPRRTDEDDDASPAEDDNLLYLVEQDNQKYRRKPASLADLYRKAREKNLLRPQPHYT